MKTLSYHILDITENCCRANATVIKLAINEDQSSDAYCIQIEDNGDGMSEAMLEKVHDPFFTSRTTRKVGLGIPLFKQNALQSGGNFFIDSKLQKGTIVKATFKLTNIDRPPVGDLPDTIVWLIASFDKTIRFIYTHKTNSGEYKFDTNEIREALDNISFSHPEIKSMLKEMIQENLEEIKATKD
ncbi:MAG: ATP-binding protein [Bacteroidales bacterium]